MQQINIDSNNGKLQIKDIFDLGLTQSNPTPLFNSIDSEYILKISSLKNIKSIERFTYDTLGMSEACYLESYYRISIDDVSYSEWFQLDRHVVNHYEYNPYNELFIEIKWIRKGTSTVGSIKLLEYFLEFDLERDLIDDGGLLNLLPGETKILKAPYIFKVFKITDIEYITRNTNLNGVNINYRISQDNSRSWSRWEPLTKENITTFKVNPIRFFQIEYSIENTNNYKVTIQDINIIGDFQNISQDYFKTNLLGIRECCQSNLYPDSNSSSISSDGCENNLPSLTGEDKNKLYNPYQQTAAYNLLSKLSEDTQSMFGFRTIYFCTDPDTKGIDKSIHEYQLYNVVCDNEIKVSVDQNNFPDNQITFNQFDLSLFESMTVHITKKQFKEIFGPQRRPSKEDFLYFCDIQRMFIVDHAQQFRNFNNTAIYYKLILKKYNKSANINVINQETQNTLSDLTKNTTINELFGVENEMDKEAVANKEQQVTLTKDLIRHEYKASIDRELIENSTTIISKSNYDLASVKIGSVAVKYLNMKDYYKVSDNIGFSIWFNVHNYMNDETYNFYSLYDENNSIGWRVDLINDNIVVKMNSNTYSIPLGFTFDEEVWYCLELNLNQRERYMEVFIYKRASVEERGAPRLKSTILERKLYNQSVIVPMEFEIVNSNGIIYGSDMKVTNIRLFNDIIPEQIHNKILNQYIIGDDSNHLIFADNATVKLFLPNYNDFR